MTPHPAPGEELTVAALRAALADHAPDVIVKLRLTAEDAQTLRDTAALVEETGLVAGNLRAAVEPEFGPVVALRLSYRTRPPADL